MRGQPGAGAAAPAGAVYNAAWARATFTAACAAARAAARYSVRGYNGDMTVIRWACGRGRPCATTVGVGKRRDGGTGHGLTMHCEQRCYRCHAARKA